METVPPTAAAAAAAAVAAVEKQKEEKMPKGVSHQTENEKGNFRANDSTGYTLIEPRHIRVPFVYRHYTHAPDHGITRHNKPQRKHPAPRASDDICYGITEVYS